MAEREHGTLVADTVANVTLTGSGDVLVICHGTGPIFVRTDGTDPTVGGDSCAAVPSNGYRILRSNDNDGSRVVKLISNATPGYSVETVEDDSNAGIGM